MEGLEAEKRTLEQALAGPLPSPVRLHPNLAEVYRAKVASQRESLANPAIRDEAIGILRGLVTGVVVQPDQDGWRVEAQGEAAALVALGLNANRDQGETLDPEDVRSARVVAGAGFGFDRTSGRLTLSDGWRHRTPQRGSHGEHPAS